jgi:hypothetical protein
VKGRRRKRVQVHSIRAANEAESPFFHTPTLFLLVFRQLSLLIAGEAMASSVPLNLFSVQMDSKSPNSRPKCPGHGPCRIDAGGDANRI